MHLKITSLVALNKRLWIGTGTGVIISVPLNEKTNSKIDVLNSDSLIVSNNNLNSSIKTKNTAPGGLVRVYGNSNMGLADLILNDKLDNQDGVIPYCNMTQAQLSFHGHKDAVRFFLPIISGIFI